MKLKMEIDGLNSLQAALITSIVSQRLDDFETTPNFTFSYEEESAPVFRGEESTFSRYLSSAKPEGETYSGAKPDKIFDPYVKPRG